MTQWKEAALEDLVIPDAPIGYGIVQPGPYASGGVPTIAIRDLLNVREDHLHRTAPSIEANYRRSRVEAGDILVSVKGTTGRVGIVPPNLKGNISRDVARLRFRDDQVPEFWLQMLRSGDAQRVLEQATVGTTRQELSIWTLRKLRFLYPSRQEQVEIAKGLSEADGLIDAIEALVTKKRDIKQGMMQELLTGHTRLPGFTSAWRELTAGDVGVFKGGNGFAIRFQGKRDEVFPFFKVSDMNNPGNEIFMNGANNTISESARERIGATAFPADAIVFAKVGAAVFLERKRILVRPSCIDNNMAAFVVDESIINPRFAHFALVNFQLSSLVAVGALPSLNGTQLRSIPLTIPSDLDEQRAIADTLTDADDELGALERHLETTCAIKTGMMQELLTGRTRLPVEAAA